MISNMRPLLISVITFFFVLALAYGEAPTASDAPPRHIVIVLVDALRADHLGCYGYGRTTSPFIDSLAAESVLFEQAYSQSSFTVESTLSLFSGLYPSANAWGGGQYANTNPKIKDLAQQLAAGGYHTAYFSTNPTLNYTELHTSFDEHAFLAKIFDKKSKSPELTARALEFMKAHTDQKTFMYLHYVSPHTPYTPPDDYYLRFAPEIYPEPLDVIDDVRAHLDTLLAEGFGPGEARFEDLMVRYDAEIAQEDDAIKALYSGLKTLGTLDDTLLVFVADHGEEFLEHGFVEHAWSLFSESIHVPLFFWMPGQLAKARIPTPVALVDILPSLLELAGLPPAEHAVDGASLFQRENGVWVCRPKEKPIIAELLNPMRNVVRAVVEGDYLYVAAPKWLTLEERVTISQNMAAVRSETIREIRPSPDPWGPLQYEALFNRKADPAEKHTILEEEPEVRDHMRSILDALQARSPKQVPDATKICRIPNVITHDIRMFLKKKGYLNPGFMLNEHAEEQEENLRSLGYF